MKTEQFNELFWRQVFAGRCETAIDKKVANNYDQIITREKARELLIAWLEKEAGFKIRGEELSIDQHQTLIMILHRKGLAI